MSAELSGSTIPGIAAPYRFQWEEAQQAYVLLYPEGMVKLNPSAGEILQLCDGERSIQGVIETLKAKFPDAELEDDVWNFMKVAHENGWIQLT